MPRHPIVPKIASILLPLMLVMASSALSGNRDGEKRVVRVFQQPHGNLIVAVIEIYAQGKWHSEAHYGAGVFWGIAEAQVLMELPTSGRWKSYVDRRGKPLPRGYAVTRVPQFFALKYPVSISVPCPLPKFPDLRAELKLDITRSNFWPCGNRGSLTLFGDRSHRLTLNDELKVYLNGRLNNSEDNFEKLDLRYIEDLSRPLIHLYQITEAQPSRYLVFEYLSQSLYHLDGANVYLSTEAGTLNPLGTGYRIESEDFPNRNAILPNGSVLSLYFMWGRESRAVFIDKRGFLYEAKRVDPDPNLLKAIGYSPPPFQKGASTESFSCLHFLQNLNSKPLSPFDRAPSKSSLTPVVK